MKMLAILLCLLCLLPSALGEGLPEGALNLWAEAYPDHAPAAWYGWGDEEAGQLLAALEKEGHYVLSMAEKKPGETWRLTLEAPQALRNDQKPDLFLDTDGDTLFFSYWEGEKKISYSASRAPSGGKEWGPVSAIVYDGLEQWVVYGYEGAWYGEYCQVDENDNILQSQRYTKQMDAAWEESLKLVLYQAGSLPLQPENWQ